MNPIANPDDAIKTETLAETHAQLSDIYGQLELSEKLRQPKCVNLYVQYGNHVTQVAHRIFSDGEQDTSEILQMAVDSILDQKANNAEWLMIEIGKGNNNQHWKPDSEIILYALSLHEEPTEYTPPTQTLQQKHTERFMEKHGHHPNDTPPGAFYTPNLGSPHVPQQPTTGVSPQHLELMGKASELQGQVAQLRTELQFTSEAKVRAEEEAKRYRDKYEEARDTIAELKEQLRDLERKEEYQAELQGLKDEVKDKEKGLLSGVTGKDILENAEGLALAFGTMISSIKGTPAPQPSVQEDEADTDIPETPATPAPTVQVSAVPNPPTNQPTNPPTPEFD